MEDTPILEEELTRAARSLFGDDLVKRAYGKPDRFYRDKIYTSEDSSISFDQNDILVIEFINGKIVEFQASEWGWMEKGNEHTKD